MRSIELVMSLFGWLSFTVLALWAAADLWMVILIIACLGGLCSLIGSKR